MRTRKNLRAIVHGMALVGLVACGNQTENPTIGSRSDPTSPHVHDTMRSALLNGDTLRTVIPDHRAMVGAYRHLMFPSWGQRTHFGVDIVTDRATFPGQDIRWAEIRSVANGVVHDVVNAPGDTNFNSLGYMVIVRHPGIGRNGQDLYSLYLHMQAPPHVGIGDPVQRGQQIGQVGSTGAANGTPHVHFELRYFHERFSAYHNIYAPRDVRNEAYALANWEDPEVFVVPGCALPNGHLNYCLECGPCGVGEGDCEIGQCENGLVCAQNIGANYGFHPTYDVCEPQVDGCPLPNGHLNYCRDCGPCGLGEGDCEVGQCDNGLVCAQNIGANYGFHPTYDVCEVQVDGCPLPNGHLNYCRDCGPCSVGEGDCEVGQCDNGLVCAQNIGANYGFHPSYDVCEPDVGGAGNWTCNPSYFGANDGCDCGCGVIDPDCGNQGCVQSGCSVAGCEYCYENGRSIGCQR